MDGIVIKADDFALQKRLGNVGNAPRWAVAYKFSPKEAITHLLNIDIQVGRTGVLTPVAILEPVKLAGVMVSRSTLHNEDYIKSRDIRIGDTVIVQRAGDVIPKVMSPVVGLRTGFEKEFVMPKNCPSCGSEVSRNSWEAAYRCPNMSCPAQALEKIKHFASKGAMDMSSIGSKMCESLFAAKLVRRISDFYYLDYDILLTLDGVADGKAFSAIESIKESKKRPLHRLIYALGIPNVGFETAILLERYFHNMSNLMDATVGILTRIPSIGEITADSICWFFYDEHNRDVIDELARGGVNVGQLEETPTKKELEGLEFVVTGKIEGYSREGVEDLIRQHGGSVKSGVTKYTTHLVVGEKPGSKLEAAQKVGAKIIGMQELSSML
jgi:DNA ligase (NAD+)